MDTTYGKDRSIKKNRRKTNNRDNKSTLGPKRTKRAKPDK